MKKAKIILTLLSILFVFDLSHSQYQQSEIETAVKGNCGIFRNVAVYGKDDREEYCSQNQIIRTLADSVAALFYDDERFILKDGNTYRFGNRTLKQAFRLADNQKFADQPSLSFCSGFLVGEDLLVTAGHCVKDDISDTSAKYPGNRENLDRGHLCKDIKVVFGYRKELGGFIPKEVSEENVYSCKKIIAHSMKSGPDYAIIKLDRKVKDRYPLAINRKNLGLTEGTKIFVMGHPSGLPLKIAGNAEVIKINETTQVTIPRELHPMRMEETTQWTHKDYSFLANLDTFAGNSGSPVINAKTLLVEGILVAGDQDYKRSPEDPFTNIVSTYPHIPNAKVYGKGTGEVVTKISVPARYIPVTKVEKKMLKKNEEVGGDLYDAMITDLLRYYEEYKKQNGIIPIPNFNPDGLNQPKVVPAVYEVPDVPEPEKRLEI